MEQFKVIIIGGGYAGIMCALRLAGRLRRKPVKIALVNPRRQFIERLRLHENLGVAHSTTLRTFDLRALLATRGVTFIEGEVTAIDRLDWCVSVRDNDKQVFQIGYERLVIAIGSRSNTNLIPGQHKNSYVMDASAKNGPEALRLAVKEASSSNIAIIGGGATGVEIAAELALRAGTKITLIDRGILGNFVLPNVAKHIRKRLAQFGVVLLENTHISEVTKNKLIINSPKRLKEIPFDICVSATGFCVSDLPANAELPIGVNGRILADSALRSIADERIYVTGDAALPENSCGAPPRMSVFFALTTGAYVASAIADDFAGKKLKPFGYWTYGQAIGLGKVAIGYNTLRFDKAVRPHFTGRAAYQLRTFFVWFLFRLLMIEHRLPGLPFYLGQPLRRTIKPQTMRSMK